MAAVMYRWTVRLRERGRARLFAAEMAFQSFALPAAADGAVAAYTDITGADGKPYGAPTAVVSVAWPRHGFA